MDASKNRIALFALLSLACVSPLVSAVTSFACSETEFNDTIMLCGIATLSMFLLIALTYMFGETMQSPRMLTWAKTEAVQAFASLVIASVILFALFTMCNFQVGEVQSVFGLGAMPKIYQDAPSPYDGGKDTIYNGAMRYTENLAAIALANVNSLRYDLGAYEIRTSYNTFECSGICIFSLASTSVSYFGGESMNLAITNNLLGIATVAYLSTIFQFFTLSYIYNGLFLIFLPLAIVMRSIPFMRHFGGALIAIFVALYLLYPLMLVADAYIAPGLTAHSGSVTLCERDARACAGKDVFSSGTITGITCGLATQDPCLGFNEWEIEGRGTGRASMVSLHPNTLGRAIGINVLIFIAAIFLPAINFIVIAAFGRELSRFLGEEADLSRLGQMV